MEQTEFQLFRIEMLRHINRIFEACATADDVAAIGTTMYEACWLKSRLETYHLHSPEQQNILYEQYADTLIEERHKARQEQLNNITGLGKNVP